MNILYIVPYVPSLVRVRPYNLIRGLSERGHRVTVMTLWGSGMERTEIEKLRALAHAVHGEPLSGLRPYWNAVQALPTAEPLQAAYCWQPALAKRLSALASSISDRNPLDVVHVEHIRGARYGLHLKAEFAKWDLHVPILWDSVDCISELFRQASANGATAFSRIVTRFDLPRTERFEAWLIDQFDHVVVTSAHDAAALRGLGPSSNPISVVANGVDLEYFTPNRTGTRRHSTIVMSGKMSYHANISMVRYFTAEVLPRIWAQRRDAQLWIVGKDPSSELRKLAQHPQIKVTGTVPDVRPYLGAAAIAVAPTPYAVGIQNKVLEAMACETPVVATPQAVSGLAADHGRELLVAGNAEYLAAAVLSLLEDPGVRLSVGRAGRQYVERHHRWSDSAVKLEGIYSELIRAAS